MGQLRISTFGGLALASESGNLPQIPSRAGRSLFAYLVTHRDTVPTRDLLAGLFWPDMVETQARRRLSHSLWQIQSVLSEAKGLGEHIAATPTSVRFNPEADYWLDVEQFDEALGALKSMGDSSHDPTSDALERLTDAIELYRGDFLAGFYDDWILLEQERLRQGLFSALDNVIRLNKSRGDFDQALLYARRLAMQDALREEAHREVMRLAYLLGRPNEALQQYERLSSILASELGTGPDAQTTALRNDIASGRESSIIPFSPAARLRLFEESERTPLVGRTSERTEITARLEQALSGSGSLVVIEGEAGIGKTRLLGECSEDANWRGLTVMWGSFSGHGPIRPFGGLVTALSDGLTPLRVQQLAERIDGVWLRALTPLIPGLADWVAALPEEVPLKPEEERDRMQEAFLQVFGALARLTPTMLVFDDIQQADHDSLLALEATIRQLDDTPLVLCLAYRRDEVESRPDLWDLLRSLGDSVSRSVIRLGELSPQETSEYVRRVMPDGAQPEFSRRLQKETGGNPLFILETLRALHEHQVTEALRQPEEAGSTIEDFPISDTVSKLILRRLERLPGEARHAMQILAVAGGGQDADFLAAVSDLNRTELLDSLGTLVGAGMVTTIDGRYALKHDQLGRVSVETIDESESRHLHSRVAEALERQEPHDVEALAFHFSTAGSEKAAKYLELAGEQAVSVRAYATAAEYYTRAVDWALRARWDSRALTRLYLALEETLDVLGARPEQARLLRTLQPLAEGDDSAMAQVLERTAWLLGHNGDFGAAKETADQAQALHQRLGQPDGMASCLRLLGTLNIWSGTAETALLLLDRGIQLAGDDRKLEAECRHALSDALTECSRLDDARSEIDRAIRIYDGIHDLRGLAGALGSSAIIQVESGFVDQGASNYQQAITLCQSIGYSQGEGRNYVNLGLAEDFRNRPAAALQAFEKARDIFLRLGDRRGEAFARANLASLRHNVLGDNETAEKESRAALSLFSELGHPRGQAQCLGTLAQIALSQGRHDDTQAALDEANELLSNTDADFASFQLQRTSVHLLLDQGRKAEALEIIEDAVKRCLEVGVTGVLPALKETQARTLFELGDMAGCLRATEDPSTSNEATALVYWRWRAQLATGDNLGAYESLVEANRRLSARLTGLSDTDSARATQAVPLQRELHEAWQAAKPRQVVVRLSAADAPTGRPTRADELVEVTWTIGHALDNHLPAGPQRRRQQLIRMLDEAAVQNALPTVDELAKAIGVSAATIRRDLAMLRAAGHRVRTRGSR